jgi:membrane protein YqaA with SNARE-associated domain
MASYFSALVDFVSAHPHYAHVAIFLLALSESIPVVGTVVPGSTLVIGISALATSANANPWLLLIAATAGAIVGDGLSFWLGQRYHQEILSSWPLNQYPQFIARSEKFITRYGVQASFLRALRPSSAPLCRWYLASSECRRDSFMRQISCRHSLGHLLMCFLVCCSQWRCNSPVQAQSNAQF